MTVGPPVVESFVRYCTMSTILNWLEEEEEEREYSSGLSAPISLSSTNKRNMEYNHAINNNNNNNNNSPLPL